MTARPEPVLVQVLRDPGVMAALDIPGWERLVRQARHADLLARVDALAQRAGTQPPPGVAEHLLSIRVLAAAQQAEVRREAHMLAAALAPVGVPVTLLKGAAYLMAGRSAAAGRLFTDVDILVPKSRIAEVEAALMLHGWLTTHHSAYDQRYYRQWMHELPPMRHLQRHTVVDVHHAILPQTARLHSDSASLLAAAQPLADDPRLQVLASADMLLHSVTHLTHNEEMSHGLRDLSDIALLIADFRAHEGFWPQLLARSRLLGLQRPLLYALRHASEILGVGIPRDVLKDLHEAGPPVLLASAMHAMWSRALRPLHPSWRQAGTSSALFLLYVRAHWLRMPPALLVRHLTVKALKLHEDRRHGQDR
jgi:hypothetical protein